MELEDEKPTRIEIERQVQKMLKSKLFKARKKEGEVLGFIVESNLDGDELNATRIGVAVWENYDENSDLVRITTSHLRKTTLKEYYKLFGAKDVVVINIAPGEGYRAEFSYNRSSQAMVHYERALSYSKKVDRISLFNAGLEFNQVNIIDRSFVPAYVAGVLTDLGEQVLKQILSMGEPWKIFNLHLGELEWVVETDPKQYLAHIAKGMVKAFAMNWEEAGKCFGAALKLDRVGTERNAWYAAYLALTGELTRAIAIAEANVTEDPHDGVRRLVHGFFLYLNHDFEKAGEAVSEVVMDGEGAILQRLLLGLAAIGMEGHALALRQCLGPVSEISQWEFAELDSNHKFKEKPERFVGLQILCLMKLGNEDEARAKIAAMRKMPYIRYREKVFGHLGMGQFDRAINALSRACWDGDIIGAWLRFLPVLDPFRADPRFQELLTMKFGTSE